MSTAGGKGEIRVDEPNRVQRTIARRAAESRATIPHLELSVEAEATAYLAQTPSDSLTATLVEACARALRAVPRANGAYRDGRFETYQRVNVGLVVATEDDLAIPVIFDADHLSLAELTEETQRLEARAGGGLLTPPELSGATFTLADVGPFGMASASPVIVPGHAAAVAAGAIRPTAAVRDGGLTPAQAMTVTLAADHRILYGRQAYAFLGTIKSHLERVGR